MKSILKNALVGLLLIAGTAKSVTEEDVKAALISIIPTGNITDTTLLGCIGDEKWGNPAWLCSAIDNLLKNNTATTNSTSFNSCNGYLPYMKTIFVDTAANTTKKLVAITENGTVVCGIIFIKTNTTYTTEYKNKADTEELLKKTSLQSIFGLSNRGLTSFYCVPKAHHGPFYTTAKIIGCAALVYAGYRFLNWYADKTPLLNEIADLKNQMANLSQRMSGHAVPTVIKAAADTTTAAAAANTVLAKVVVPASKSFIDNAIAAGQEIIKRH